MELCLTYDMRAPEFGAQRNYLFDTAIEQVSWADELGFDTVGLGEHHCAEDGYNPSPLILASAMGARSRHIKLRTSVLLAPLYDLPKLAEDAAVTQIICNGRLLLGIGAGYRPEEFESFGRSLDDRWRDIGETCEFLRHAWTGETFEWRGRKCRVTPRPEPFAPPILLGGSSPAAARRAARIADDWFPPLDARLWQPYRDECLALGRADPGPYPAQGPIFLWIAEDTERAWELVYPHVLHQLESYSAWTEAAFGRPAGPYAGGFDRDSVRRSGAYQVLTPDDALALAESLGDHSVLYLNPLLAGLDPRESWRMLHLYEQRVHPYLPRRESA
jgi:alkanesulfonate monooxygenase SsuD/methylene tetrahydromethanopterin reductase-like flavin-dependent oxidoreductase (luciferase family)